MPAFVRRALPYIAACVCYYAAIRFFSGFLIPVIAAAVLASLLRIVSGALNRRFRIPVKLSCALLILIFTAFALIFTFTISARLAGEIEELLILASDGTGEFTERLSGFFDLIAGKLPVLPHFNGGLPFDGGDIAYALGSMLRSVFDSILRSLPGLAADIGGALPIAVFKITMTIMAAYYLGSDYESTGAALNGFIPDGAAEAIRRTKRNCMGVCSNWLRSSAATFGFVFAILLAGMCVLRVEYAFAAALITAFTDMLPVLGSGMILLPWACFELLCGRNFTGFGLIIVFAAVTLLKQIAEPLIIGSKGGHKPLLTIASMYIGMTTLGVAGAILTPPFVFILLSEWQSQNSSRSTKSVSP